MRVWVGSSSRFILSFLVSAGVLIIFPPGVSELGRGSSTACNVVARPFGEVARPEALEGLVTILLSDDFVVLEVDVASCVASVDGQTTSVLSSFILALLGGDTVIKDSIVGDIDSHFLIGGLVDDNTVDTVVISDVVLKVEGSFEVKITGDVDSRSINDSWLVVLSIVLNTCAKVGKVLSEEEWEAITVSVYGVAIDGVGAASLSFSEDDSRCTSGGPPDGSVDEILGNSDIVAFVAPDT